MAHKRIRIHFLTGCRFWTLVLLALMPSNLQAQLDYGNKFAKVKISESQRIRLVERLVKFVEFEMQQKFEEQFALIPPGESWYDRKEQSRDSYARFKRESVVRDGQLTGLTVKRVDTKLDKNMRLSISVSVERRKDDKVYKNDPIPIMSANFLDGEWYISLVYFTV